MSFNFIEQNFKTPPREYGPVPFLALNSDLKPAELEWALKELARAGIAGVFLHPRTGLELEYLSEEFFDRMGIAIETCASLGLKAWLYDEYNWPSGVAGGKLLSVHPEFRQRFLDYLFLEKPVKGKFLQLPGEVVAVFSVGEEVEPLKGMFEGAQVWVPPLNNPVLIFYQAIFQEQIFANSCAPWVKREPGYLDLMNPDAGKAFIELVYEEYARRFSEHFGKTIPGIFTDEPQNYNGFPWSLDFPKKFQAQYGYDPVPHLYLLLLDRKDFIKFRVQFYELVARGMREGFYLLLSRWCQEHNLILTGHLGMEERITQMAVNNGGIYPHLSLMGMPGLDALNVGDGLNGGLANMEVPNFSVKAVSSIAHLWERARVLCESGGGAGWQMTLWRFKQMCDWLFGLGVNFINPHLCLLSIKGLRKRDFPPSHFWQEPWWEYYPEFSQYLARVSWLLSQGVHQAEIAVLIPSSELKALAQGRGYKPEKLSRLSREIEELVQTLLMAQRDFEFIFEEAIEEGKVKVSHGKILAGAENFKILIVPEIRVISEPAMELIEKFALEKGLVFFLGSLPSFNQKGEEILNWQTRILSARDSVRIFSVPRDLPEQRRAPLLSGPILLLEALSRVSPPELYFSSPKELKLILHKRKIGTEDLYFLANLEPIWLRLKAFLKTEKTGIQMLMPNTGEVKKLPFERTGSGISFTLELMPLNSIIIIASDQFQPSWILETELFLTEFDDQKISGFSPEPKAKLKTLKQEIQLESNSALPPPISLKGPFSFQALSPNLFRLGPFRVITEKIPPLPLSGLKEEFFFSNRTRFLIYFLRPLINLMNLITRPESHYPGLFYLGFGRLEQELIKFSRLVGISLEQKGLYQMIDLLFRFSDYLPLRTWFRNYPAPGAYYEAHTDFFLESVLENLELVFEDLGEKIEVEINGRRIEERFKPVRVWDDANVALEVSEYLRNGRNHLVFRSRMPSFPSLFPSFHTIEPIVLRGEFEVKKKGIIKKAEKFKPGGDLIKLGYPHYLGKVKYQTEVEIPREYLNYYLVLDCGEVRDQLEVFVNGKSAGKKFGPPYQFPVRDLVQEGKNQLTFMVSNTVGNLLSRLEPFGLLGPVKILPFYWFSKSREEVIAQKAGNHGEGSPLQDN